MKSSKRRMALFVLPLIVMSAVFFGATFMDDEHDLDAATCTVTTYSECGSCGGTGKETCPDCGGQGWTASYDSDGDVIDWWGCGTCGGFVGDGSTGSNGTGEVDCGNCGGSGEVTSTYSYNSHSYRTSTTYGTCNGSKTTYTCSRCGYSYSSGSIDNTHSYTYYSAKSATCTSSGNKAYYYCSDCGTYFTSSKTATAWSSLSISALGHSYVNHAAKSATCTASGYSQYYSCSNCSSLFNSSKTAISSVPTTSALGHSYSASTYTWASDYSKCTVKFVCSRDSSHTGTSTISSTSKTSGNATTYTVSGTDSTYKASYSQSKTLYTHTATLKYDAAGGSGAPSSQSASTTGKSSSASGSKTFTLSSGAPTYAGYVFQGWATSSGAASAGYQPGGSISVAYGSTTTLYAVWKPAALEIASEPSTGILKVGQRWSYTPEINVSGCTVAVTGADWLSVSDGTISGTPDAYGTYDITVTVSKDGGYAGAQQSFSLTVCSVLVFTSVPSAEGVCAYAS